MLLRMPPGHIKYLHNLHFTSYTTGQGRQSSQVPWVLGPGDAVRRWPDAVLCSALGGLRHS